MRLIDLDQTIFVPIVDESNGGVEYEMEMTIGEMFDKFLGGFQPEIVDAVPVKWLEQLADYMRNSLFYDEHESEGIDEAVILWQKDQEAR